MIMAIHMGHITPVDVLGEKMGAAMHPSLYTAKS
jgi:hypothetical protein